LVQLPEPAVTIIWPALFEVFRRVPHDLVQQRTGFVAVVVRGGDYWLPSLGCWPRFEITPLEIERRENGTRRAPSVTLN
jgi:hypothetical protein